MALVPWVEKYRPATLAEVVASAEMLKTMQQYVESRRVPHLLLYGPPGTGKTSTALALARQLYASDLPSMLLELNASDERGIGVVRGEIITFASSLAVSCNANFKMVLLDEADQMTKDAQNALRRIMEKYTANVRFAILCNRQSAIIGALQSRCTRFRFAPLGSELMLKRLAEIASSEGLHTDEQGLRALARLARGDMRRALNLMQSTAAAHDNLISEHTLYLCSGQPQRADMELALDALLTQPFSTAFRKLHDLQLIKGIALQDLLLELHKLLLTLECAGGARAHARSVQLGLQIELAEIEARLARGSSERVQLAALVAAFQPARALAH